MTPTSLLSLDSLKTHVESLDPGVSRIFVLVDKHTRKHCLPVLKAVLDHTINVEEVMVGHGEQSKSMARAIRIIHQMLRNGVNRNSLIINLGGGVVSDLGGFVASVLKRGIRFINIPTSLMGMVDAAHGGKTAINIGQIKNQIGTYNSPEAVIIHTPFLLTLPPRHLLSGFVEMLKHGIIADKSYYHSLTSLMPMQIPEHSELIFKSIEIKTMIVGLDPFDTGIRSILNVGHTVGHAVETIHLNSGKQTLSHGHAVALGIAVESKISTDLGFLDPAQAAAISEHVFAQFTKPKIDVSKIPALLRIISHDKKNIDGKIKMPLITSIGSAIPSVEVEEALVKACISEVLCKD